ncbi:MAG: DUF882 domain-containing protein [Alphaproteobacteria bacterium]|nr:DUF882 domain-containing protein [Alphaproteobacteria bacterium]
MTAAGADVCGQRVGDTLSGAGGFERRGFLLLGLASVAALAIPQPAEAAKRARKTLSFYNTHTGEWLRTEYAAKGRYVPEALREIDHFLRDHRTDEVHRIDPKLLDVLHALRLKLDSSEPFHVISGYRSPKTNAMLARQDGAVARRSQHVLGRAVDFRMPGRTLRTVRRAAMSLKAGGVGYYPRSRFVHVDVGRVRFW